MSYINKLLIANRGEIACRVMHTAKRLGINTVAVFSTADQNALHVSLADEAICVGPAAATESYLSIANILDAAKRCGADAIHPGYGFLSENAAFARACEAADITFVGPTPAAMDVMASKSAAKQLMQDAGVPVLPGYHDAAQDLTTLKEAANITGYPLMLKASAGGGGKGMRIVMTEDQFEPMLAAVKREAMASFSDDHVLFERYVEQPRHIEIQVFSDTHGHHLHLFERDCSVQRRHQKVLEEAPAPNLSDQQRKTMGKAAVEAAKAIDYRGAGTVEFIADPAGNFYFMEMNTRLQVEHPVTEMITGQDLVEWQLLVASGAPLPATQEELSIKGHSIEARIYAEDTENGFLPATGQLKLLEFPEPGPHLRVETGVTQGDTVSVFYDPMIAKLVVWGKDRQQALQNLDRALGHTFVIGPATNVQYLRYLAAQPDFQQGKVDTGFIARLAKEIVVGKEENGAATFTETAQTKALLLAAIWNCEQFSSIPLYSWRLNLPTTERSYWTFVSGNSNEPHQLNVQKRGAQYSAWLDGDLVEIQEVAVNCDLISIVINKIEFRARIRRSESVFGIYPDSPLETGHSYLHDQHESGTPLSLEGAIAGPANATVNRQADISAAFTVRKLDTAELDPQSNAMAGSLLAPMPGKIIAIHVSPGESVISGQALLVLEAMKMEHIVSAPRDGVIAEVCFSENDLVPQKAPLVRLQETDFPGKLPANLSEPNQPKSAIQTSNPLSSGSS